jgi:hypothetical protein
MFKSPRTDPLNVFIHVPKTAGSTVNAHLAAWARGLDHVEHLANTPTRLTRKLRTARWASGHLALNKMQHLLAQTTQRPIRLFGLMRDPVRQVASQYNWLMEIGHRGGRFFRNHPQGLQDFSTRLRTSDNSDPDVVVTNILAKPGLFLNLQARFLLGDDLHFNENAGLDRLDRYTHLTTDPAVLSQAITGAPPTQQRRENTSPYHFDRAVFDSDQVQIFLQRNHRHDLRLFERLSAADPKAL